jgi:hypothetical protein
MVEVDGGGREVKQADEKILEREANTYCFSCLT